MPKISTKRQITLPLELCNIADIHSGDDVDSYVERSGVISIVKKTKGAAKGLLSNVVANSNYSDQESLESSIRT
jgi:bifunctional DNA-binding transcriptional regulator/antitoxin component of YhaV-PrlF toxin-antitoxin module